MTAATKGRKSQARKTQSGLYAEPMDSSAPGERTVLDLPEALLNGDLAPLFWRPERMDQPTIAWLGHTPFAHWLIGAQHPRVLVELGTHAGVSYSAFCSAVLKGKTGTRCFAVDTWRGDEQAGIYSEAIFEDFKRFHDERYAEFSELLRCTFDEASTQFADSSIDLLHIDGLHTYEAVRHDFEQWFSKLSDRAIVLFHDTNERQADFGVWKLWEELRGKYPSFEFPHSHGLGVLLVGKNPAEAIAQLCQLDSADAAIVQRRMELFGDRWRVEAAKTLEIQRLSRTLPTDVSALNAELAAARKQIRAGMQALEKANTNLVARDEDIAALEHKVQERDQQTALLNREIELIHSSRIWRYGSFLRRLASFPNAATLYAGRTIALRALHHLEGLPLGKRVTEWTITGDDPQFELLWRGSQPLPPGHYRLSAYVPAEAEALTDARLYVDSGRGYNEIERIDLRFRSNGKGLAASTFPLSVAASKLRFDPSDRSTQITIGRVRLRRLARVEYYACLIARILARHVKSPGSLVRSAARGVKLLRQSGLRGFAATLRSAEARGALGSVTYEGWIALNDTPTEQDVADLSQRLAQLEKKPLISVLMPVYNTPERLLREAIESVRAQIYQNWELCIADDCSTEPHVRRVLNEYAKRDPRIKVVLRDKNGHISRASNSALEIVTGEWVAMLDHDDILRPHALAEIVLEVDRHPDAELVYSDEDKIDLEGRRYDPCFKPDFSRELFRSQNYLNHLTAHRAENIRAVGGWRPGFEGSQDYDLNLRVIERIAPERIRHIPKVLYHWRAVEGSTALDGSQKNYAYMAGLRALDEYVERMGIPARAEEAPGIPCYRLRFFVPEPQPLVSLIVPTRDKVELLRRCVESIREKTTYRNYEILVVDNGSVEEETLAYFSELKEAKNVRVLRYDKPFNYSAINNFAVGKAKGSIIGLVNNDIEVISPDWLTEMVSWAVQPDVGCVGAKLYYGNDTIQHGGVIVGLGGVANHSHKHFPRHHPGYFCRLKVLQNLSAVTAACLLIRKSLFKEVGGLNEVDLTVAFNDVDLCLKVQEAGYSNVWTPYAELYHLESVSRGVEDAPEKMARFNSEIAYMQRRWKKIIERDPFYSPNLTKAREDFSLG